MKNFAEVAKKILCVGRNYRAHAQELGNAVPDKPMFFMKPTSAFIQDGGPIRVSKVNANLIILHKFEMQCESIPPGCNDLNHEVELAIIVGERMSKVTKDDAEKCIAGYALALDMTARDFQDEAKKKGHPWLLAKAFDTSCPISDFIPKEKIPNPGNVGLWCKVNGTLKQNGNTKDMIFPIPNLLEFISQYITLEPGDVILTGTPEGVGRVNKGDVIECGIEGVTEMRFTVE